MQDVDPDLAQVLRLMEGTSDAYISQKSGFSRSQLRNWRNRKVRRPQNASINAVLKSLGYKRIIVEA